MSNPFMSEIRLMSFSFAPKYWARCEGQLLPINQNQGLFSLLGTTYGGDGRVTFALPDLRGRVPIHEGSGHTLGERAGEVAHTLTPSELPAHNHPLFFASTAGDTSAPTSSTLPAVPAVKAFADASGPLVAMDGQAVAAGGGGNQPHQNMQPYLVMTYCIALQGIFPSPV